ncbi:hypothetical protein WISP_49112 [Willisornis vidua]|uniref:Uncharacterized protein n=1 Tax=Willisornis vidua TaxID=1566151 RepID=A0ABQ9DKA8_9PASS|nr:hypothetical protein WISP_49112 [Willisornis vidua]
MAADPAEQFCVAEERSGHCAVVDGNFLYVWGGYVSIEENEVYLPNDELWIYEMDSGLIYFGGYGCRKRNELSDCFDVHDAFWEGQIFWGWHNDVHVFDTTTQTWFQPPIRFTIIQIFPGKRLCKEPERARKCHEASPIHLSGRKGHLFPKLELELVKEDDDDDDQNQLYQESFENRLRSVMWTQFLQGHCSDLLIFQTQPYSLLRLCLDCIGKNAALLENQIPHLPSKLLQEVLKKITFWAAVTHRQERKAETERQNQLSTR